MSVPRVIKDYVIDFLCSSPEQLEGKLLNSDIVSFDIFDTALVRKCGEPQEIFKIIEETQPLAGFKRERVMAEEKARRTFGARTNLSDIYKKLEEVYGEVRSKELLRKELEVETENLIMNARIHSLYKKLQNKEIPVFFVSDMYLSSSFLAKILKDNGYGGSPLIIVSNEYGSEKRDGSLYECLKPLLKNRFPGKRSYRHVGDSVRADFFEARIHGIKSFLIERGY